MAKLPILGVLLAGLSFTGLSASVEPVSQPVCKGGPFQGPSKPDRPPEIDDPRNCRALPTHSRDILGHGPMPRGQALQGPRVAARNAPAQQASFQLLHNPALMRIRSTVAPRSSATASGLGYHHAGGSTNDFAYTGIYGVIQVRDPDLSQSGAHVMGSYLWTPDGNNLYQTGWVDEAYGSNTPLVFVESNIPGGCCRHYFTQYPLSDGGQYYFAVISKPASKYAMIWWNGTWNVLHSVSSTLTREGIIQQFLEVYLYSGLHPNIPTLSNYDSQLVYQDTNVYWDTAIGTNSRSDSPYVLNYVTQYHNWQAGS